MGFRVLGLTLGSVSDVSVWLGWKTLWFSASIMVVARARRGIAWAAWNSPWTLHPKPSFPPYSPNPKQHKAKPPYKTECSLKCRYAPAFERAGERARERERESESERERDRERERAREREGEREREREKKREVAA